MTRGYFGNMNKWFYGSGVISVLLAGIVTYCWLQLVSVSAQISATTTWHEGDTFYAKFVFFGWLFCSVCLLITGFLLIAFADIHKDRLLAIINVLYLLGIFGGVCFVESGLTKHTKLPSSVDLVVVLLSAGVMLWCFICLLVDMHIYRKVMFMKELIY